MDKPWNVSETEFQKNLEKYTIEDYEQGIPYQYLAHLMQCNYSKYFPYSSFLLEDAANKGLDLLKATEIGNMIKGQVNKTHIILDLINNTLSHKIPEDKVGVLPIMCGNGKSSAVSQKIIEVLNAENSKGLIVVTDSVERLNEYIRPEYNEILSAYFAEHDNKITVLHADTLLEASQKQHSTPILLMTTQRFFSLSPDEIKEYTKWDGGVRDTILIDERPPLRNVIHVNRGDIHLVASALVDGIGNEANQNEKMWCLQEWSKVQARFYKVCDDFENRFPEKKYSYFFYTNPERCVTEDDERFLHFISDNEASLKRYKNGAAHRILKAVFVIEREGAVFQSQKGNYYGDTFSVLIDNREMLTNIGAKVLILDGTADLHPDYEQEYIHRPKLEWFEYDHIFRNLESLSLYFVDFPTSKLHLLTRDCNHDAINGILSYLDSIEKKQRYIFKSNGSFCIIQDPMSHNPKLWPIFTYKELEGYLHRNGYKKLEHFGNIKGRNDFKNYDNLVQVGLHRFDPLYYLTYKLYTTPGMIEQFRNMPEQQCSEMIEEIVKNPHSYEDIMYAMILEDIEQNFFRGSIRKNEQEIIHNNVTMSYWIFCNTKTNKTLIELAKKRYNKLSAAVYVVEDPPQKKHAKAMSRKVKRPSAYQLCCQWLDNVENGRIFKRADILKEAGISAKAFEEMLRKHPEIKRRLEGMAVEGKKHIYRKN